MAPLAVDPAALEDAGAAVVSAGEGLESVVSGLVAALSGGAGMAGDDPAGAAFGRSYDAAAAELVKAMATARNALCGLGDGVRVSAHNYSVAEALSDVAGRSHALPMPVLSHGFTTGLPPSAVGASRGAPAGWGWVAPYVGMIWPTGDSAKLRAAAQAWTGAGTKFALTEVLGTGRPMEMVRSQQIPEGAAVEAAFSDAYTSTTGIVHQCESMAAQLTSYAAAIDAVHAAILDLLSRICDPMTGIKEVWEVLTGEDEDEIRRIANDIRTVVDHFSAEVAALGAQIAGVMAGAGRVITTMSSHAQRQWDQFLHGSDVGRNVDTAGQYFKGIGLEAGGTLKGLWEISQPRALIDPLGFHHSMTDMVKGALPLAGLGGEHAPSVEESWKQLGKSLSHWDEFQSNPAEALGKSVFDLGTFALPGGPLSKLGKAGHSAADALKGLKKPPSFEPPSGRPPVELPEPGPKPPEPGPKPPPPKPLDPGNPTQAPAAKPTPSPTSGPLPHGPVESKPPMGGKPSAGESLRPTAAVPGSGSKPLAPLTAEQTSAPHPQPANSVPAQLVATAPHSAQTPQLASMVGGGASAEAAPAFGGGSHAADPGGHQSGRSYPPSGGPHPPGDGGGTRPHHPDEGKGSPPSHPPADGSPTEDLGEGDQSGHTKPSDLPPWRQAQLGLAESPEQLVSDLVRRGCPPDIAESALHSPYTGMTAQQILDKFWNSAEGTWRWPEHNGFADGQWETARSIPEDVWLDRIGEVSDGRGDFMGAVGDSYPKRSLAPGTSGDYHVFQGTGQPIPDNWEVRYGNVSEAFGQPGGGSQWVVVDDEGEFVFILRLIDDGYLRKIQENPSEMDRTQGDRY
ncbi:NAD(+)--arginine ADP-ribosyltransferase [Mycobacterium kubicae]|uniref:glycohydrolase toxin TNT-related protein n=1 Tax=Mycobacterium kubicae TaxID=120959 RepID=UPI0007FD3D8A|nr:glycohydrolase toxin TNT-related protein [Mycobacterium kubicae]OBF24313.1 NAD(+)--arginine ADP-ribosyltransferase [Mycobacterium kubicae]